MIVSIILDFGQLLFLFVISIVFELFGAYSLPLYYVGELFEERLDWSSCNAFFYCTCPLFLTVLLLLGSSLIVSSMY